MTDRRNHRDGKGKTEKRQTKVQGWNVMGWQRVLEFALVNSPPIGQFHLECYNGL